MGALEGLGLAQRDDGLGVIQNFSNALYWESAGAAPTHSTVWQLGSEADLVDYFGVPEL